MQNKKTTIAIVVLVVVILGIFLIMKIKANSTTEVKEVSKKMVSNAPALTDVQQEQIKKAETATTPSPVVFNISGGNFYFVPNMITVKKGSKVTINFKNDGGSHNFKLDEFNVATNMLESGDTESVTFTADKVGAFEYYCSFGQHRAMGMKGTLTVVE